jgi:hypothetical protein
MHLHSIAQLLHIHAVVHRLVTDYEIVHAEALVWAVDAFARAACGDDRRRGAAIRLPQREREARAVRDGVNGRAVGFPRAVGDDLQAAVACDRKAVRLLLLLRGHGCLLLLLSRCTSL